MVRLIKKYKNRRLYDTEKSQYITMDDLRGYIAKEIPFCVIDSVTQKDLTNVTLLQILVEMEMGPTHFLSTEILKQLIMLAQHPVPTFFQKAMEEFIGQWQGFFTKP